MADTVVGRALYETDLDNRKLKSGLQQNEKAFQKSGSAAERAFGSKAQNGLKSLTGSLGIATIGIGAFVAVAATSVKAAVEEESSIQKLDSALKANVQGWDGNKDAIDAHLQSMIKLGFADDEVRESLSQLVVKTGDVEEAMRLSALAADVARLKNISHAAASDLVYKASTGAAKALKELGLEHLKGADSATILAAAEEKVGTQAEDAGNTAAGSFRNMEVQLGEAQETIGQELLPALMEFVNFVTDVAIPAFQTMTDSVKFNQASEDMYESMGLGDIERAIDDLWAKVGITAESDRHKLQVLAKEHAREIAAKAKEEWLGLPVGQAFAIRKGQPLVEGAMWDTAGIMRDIARQGRIDAVDEVSKTPGEMGAELSAGDDLVREGLDDLVEEMQQGMADYRRIQQIEEQLASAEMEKGLASQDSSIRLKFEQRRADLIRLKMQLTHDGYSAGFEGYKAIADGILASIPYISDAAGDALAASRMGRTGVVHRAGGGPVMTGMPYMVGENGPEMFVPNEDGRIRSHAQSMSLAGTGTLRVVVEDRGGGLARAGISESSLAAAIDARLSSQASAYRRTHQLEWELD